LADWETNAPRQVKFKDLESVRIIPPPKYSPKDIYSAFYTELAPYQRKPNDNPPFSFSTSNGYSNGRSHVIGAHPNWEENVQTISMKHPKIPRSLKIAVSDWASSIHGWMELVIMEDNPFTIVESETYKRAVKYSPMNGCDGHPCSSREFQKSSVAKDPVH
jgi:hypothetical protein